jgi:isocitrate dehydrogenase (NAD+)
MNNEPSRSRSVTLIPGDGIGPEITSRLIEVFEALGNPFKWECADMGLSAYEKVGDPLPWATIDSIARTGLAIKGPIQTPLGVGFRSPLVRIREEFQLYANLRPARTLLLDSSRASIDLVVVRENTEGLYASKESYVEVGNDPRGLATATATNSRMGCMRILRFAFDYAVKHHRHKVTVVHKANVLKILSGIFLEASRELYRLEYAGLFELEEMIIDACAMKMVMSPTKFDVIVTTNMFGDILSDLAAGLTGGLGLAPGANIGNNVTLYEAVHGSAPEIAGKGIANPVAILLSGAMLLEHAGELELAQRLQAAIHGTLNIDKVLTPDLGGTATCEKLTGSVINRL